jgi:hypothetical protein
MAQLKNGSTGQNSLPLALKIAALEQAQAAADVRIAERAEGVEKLATAISAATREENKATAHLLETKLSGVDARLEQSIETQAKALDTQAKEYARRLNLLDTAIVKEHSVCGQYVDTRIEQEVTSHRDAREKTEKELERRLGIIDTNQEKYLLQKVYEKGEEMRHEDNVRLEAWRGTVNTKLSEAAGRNSERSAMIALLFSVLSFLGMLLALFLAFGHRAVAG